MKNVWIKALLTGALLLGATGCVQTNDIEVESVSNDKANLKAYKTYQFLEDSGIVEEDKNGKLKRSNSEVAELVEEVINEQLQRHGKKPTAKDPDFLVAYVGGSNMEAVVAKVNADGKQIIEKKPAAALLIMLVDADTGEILRIATAEGDLKNQPIEEKRARIEYAVKKMLSGI